MRQPSGWVPNLVIRERPGKGLLDEDLRACVFKMPQFLPGTAAFLRHTRERFEFTRKLQF